MTRMIFVSLPVSDLAASRRFYSALGFHVNEACSDDRVVCVVVSDRVAVMLLERSRFADFVTTEVADAHTTTEVITGLSAETRAEVDAFAEGALANGGSPGTTTDDGPVYGRTVRDPDGHVWEVMHMPVG